MKIFISVIDPSAKLYISRIIPYLDGEIFSTSAKIGRVIANLDGMSVVGMPSVKNFFLKFIEIVNFLNSTKIDIGVFCDSPDFNIILGILFRRIQKSAKMIYFIPPSVWAWRPERQKIIEENFNSVICILPFEKDIWKKNGIYVGHPLCKIIKEELDLWKIREIKGESEKERFAFLPGSRYSEVKNHGDIIECLPKFIKGKEILVPTDFFWLFGNDYKVVPMKLSRWVIYVSNFVISASGTAVLESALLGRPTVVFYKLPKTVFEIAKRMVKVPFISLPNLILGKEVFPELLQEEANPQRIYQEIQKLRNRDFSNYAEELFCALDGFSFEKIAQIIQS